MYVIIAGSGAIGASLALSLSQENHNVVVVESDPDSLKPLGSGFNGLTITGMPIDEDVLKSAGIEQADALAAVTDDDNMNIMVSQVALELFHVPKVITRLHDPARENVFHRLGMKTVCSTTLCVTKIKKMLLPDESFVFFDFGGVSGPMKRIRPNRGMIGKTIAACKKENILCIIRNGRILTANTNTEIEATDMLLATEVMEESYPI